MRKLVIALLCLLSPAMHAADLPAEVTLSVGETVLLMTDLRRAALGKGRVVSLATPEQGQLLLFGESPGETTAQLWLKDGTQHLLRIQVRDKDPARLMEEVRALLNGARITARVSGRHILLEGNRAGTEDRKRAGEVAALFPGEVLDFTDAGAWESMVQFQVRLVEVRRDQLHRLGLRWDQEASGPAASITAGWPGASSATSTPKK